jgi:hypothetical protein
MKKIMFVCALAMAACGGGKKADTMTKDTTTTNTDTGSGSDTGSAATTSDGQPCTQEVALQCPDDQIDGCLKTPAEGDTHKCVAK